jgi:hypothetical protein
MGFCERLAIVTIRTGRDSSDSRARDMSRSPEGPARTSVGSVSSGVVHAVKSATRARRAVRAGMRARSKRLRGNARVTVIHVPLFTTETVRNPTLAPREPFSSILNEKLNPSSQCFCRLIGDRPRSKGYDTIHVFWRTKHLVNLYQFFL